MANIVDGSVLDKELNPEQAAAAKKINGPDSCWCWFGKDALHYLQNCSFGFVPQCGIQSRFGGDVYEQGRSRNEGPYPETVG